MILRCLTILITLQLSLIEACVRTMPPEEVYITSTPDNLPVTDDPVTNEPITEVPISDVPVTDVPITEDPITDTPVCSTECDASSILHTPTDFDLSFTSKSLNALGECDIAEVTCERLDDKICRIAEISVSTPSITYGVVTFSTSKATAFVKCERDGTFSLRNPNNSYRTDLSQLRCRFSRCA
ncbi:unnamed protein product [Caenorhabditis nigoni]